MIRAIVEFPNSGSLMTRWENSMRKYLPDDVRILQVLDRRTLFSKGGYDIVIGLCPSFRLLPFLSFTSPKAIWTEAIDEVFLSRFSSKDLIVTYDLAEVKELDSIGYNIISLPPPIETETFYPEHCNKIYDVMTINLAGWDWANKVDNVLSRLGLKHLIMTKREGLPGSRATYDFCRVPHDNDRMRDNYCSSKYVVSFVPEHEYYPGKWTVGWESGNAEGLLCGARPIFYKPKNAMYYDQWLGRFMEYVDEEKLEDELERVLLGEYKPVTQDEINEAASFLSAAVVWEKFWQKVREVLQ